MFEREDYESFVEKHSSKEIKERYDFYLEKRHELCSDEEIEAFSLAIMTFIALGECKDLEDEFPDFKDANPVYLRK